MTSSARSVLEAALALPEDERRRVAEAILDSLAQESEPEIETAWRDEVMRRIEEVQRGEVVPVPWSEVKQRIREALGR
jgi:putative addiction module component (TIGR02574 family)